MSNSLFFFITIVYISWVAISGAKAKQKRDVNAAKPGQPGVTDMDKIALAENASFCFDGISPAYEPEQTDPHHSYEHGYSNAVSELQ
ncbi:MAG TPA: hypothetical protein VFW07_25810 [Parafilimonas sp.]|nr:hypothetical protein [Parafilimonas sp.]